MVETSLGTWQWVRGDEPGLGFSDDPGWVELPDPPLPAIEELVWPQLDPELGRERWPTGAISGVPVTSGDVTIVPAGLVGQIDWSRVYTAPPPYGWVEGRWRPLEGECPFVEVCATHTATLEITPVRVEQFDDGGTTYPEGWPVDVLVATILQGDPEAVEFRDEETGDLILRVEATDDVTAAQLMQAGQQCSGGFGCGGGLILWELYVDGVGWVEPPWRRLELRAWPVVEAGPRGDGLWMVGFEGPRDSTTMHVWGSSDGVNWEKLATRVPLGESFPSGFQAELIDGELVILTPYSNPDEPPVPPKVLRLADGEFTEVAVDLSRLGDGEIQDFTSTPWGWMATTGDGTCDVWVSADGNRWEEITTPDGGDTGETVHVFTHEISDDGSHLTAENPVPTPAEDVPAALGGSYCSLADDGSVYLEFDHQIDGVGTVWEGENYPKFFVTSWVGELVRGGQ